MSVNMSTAKKIDKKYKELAAITEGRANIYKLLASFLMTEPSWEMVSNILKPEVRENLTVLFGKRATNPLNAMAASFKKEDMDELVQEFHDLFLVQFCDKYTTPYESVYLTGLMLQRPHVEVKRMFKAAGAKFNFNQWINIEDYLGAELGFMEYLCQQEAKSWLEGKAKEALNFIEYENAMLEKHLLLWVDEVCDQIAAKAELGLYKALARITKKFVNSDYDYISDQGQTLKELVK